MKKQILSIPLGVVMLLIGSTTYAFDTTPVKNIKLTANEKAVNNFNKQFKNSGTPIISAANHGFITQSDVENNKVTAAYNKKGNWDHTIKYFTSSTFEKNITSIVKESYHHYFISGMEKIDQPGNESVYVVYLENNNSLKTLSVSDGQVELVQNFQKSGAGNT